MGFKYRCVTVSYERESNYVKVAAIYLVNYEGSGLYGIRPEVFIHARTRINYPNYKRVIRNENMGLIVNLFIFKYKVENNFSVDFSKFAKKIHSGHYWKKSCTELTWCEIASDCIVVNYYKLY